MAAVAAGGATTALATTHEHHDRAPTPGPGNAQAQTPVGADQAMAAALKAVPGTVGEADLDGEYGRPAWEVDVLARNGGWHEVLIDGRTGATLGQRPDRDPDGEAALASGKATTTAQQAVEIARRASPGTVTSVEIEGGGRTPAWEVELTGHDGTHRELTIDAASGSVTANTVEGRTGHDTSEDGDD
ncbi:PepSY domain-containing protein [Actinomadura barringtoniae]|uniref:PepSY domain-containing protein n=1 Tax=Actinomadura barringtoniae TaxID=1427535 RepID=A0A939PIB0_9ACTN|nr:PepSY domain-containing protein [Actinomadura barringtoniae]MBO2452698.1 PepSY domain-containing protein [Actinomadura barringtoniae]